MSANRQPNQSDLLMLAEALANCGVEYVVIGGAAMALHGFPRMTKDIDLLLPINAENNKRLLRALESLPNGKEALAALRPEWMDKGFSTALEAEIYVDLLYVAAENSFEDLRKHIQTVMVNGVPIITLDVDGMLLSKNTTREEDIPDRLKLGRLKNAQHDFEVQARIDDLPKLEHTAGVSSTFWRNADAAIKQAGGAPNKVTWKQVEEITIMECIGEALCAYSPGAASIKKREAIHALIEKLAPTLQAKYEQSRSDSANKGYVPN
ncbi:DUF6036 family nucleotidyltransferase [Noviherbaspirillum sedimenti]|uniref:DUF6036 family nucleotidyltransferase n=1 Tax=Noviherbaspirillum sedimenti TaxID=2320865 RepID=UPI0018F29C47|nr:DUF6036 family nucleotidyltransferase [Noviherbaspirillum sedimenti]